MFGLVERREETPESDIDKLVQLPKGTTLFHLVRLTLDLENLLGRKIDLGTDVRDSLRVRVEAEAVRIV